MNDFLAALRFLTIIPVPSERANKGAVLAGFPAVGALLGIMMLAVAALFTPVVSASVVAVLLLLLWVAVTGALHIDAVGDAFDALLGGVGSRERSLQIMKDPLLGAAGAAAIGLLLLLKFVMLEALVSQQLMIAFLVPMLARSSAILLFFDLRYVSERGLAVGWSTPRALTAARLAFLVAALLLLYSTGVVALLLTVAVIAALYYWWRQLWQRRIGGFTGDVAGALIELQEVALLLVLLLV